jgi:hypothetical protein
LGCYSEDTTGGTVRRRVVKTIKPPRKESRHFERGDGAKFSFLEKNNVMISREQLHKNITTFFMISQSSDILAANRKSSIH